MERSVKEIPLGNGTARYEVRIEGDGDTSPMSARQLLRALVDTPGMLDCGFTFFQKLTISRSGGKWIATMEAIE